LRGFTGLSQRGQRVTLAEEVGTYVGAQPYFTVRYGVRSGPKGGADTIRYTPSLERAHVILRHFLSDVTDSEGLALRVELARPQSKARQGAAWVGRVWRG
jgi:hypothetical protein